MQTSHALFAAAILAMSFMPAYAAPDDTLGMALMSASVNGDGTLARGSGASSSRNSAGSYTVIFERSVANCTCTASGGYPVVNNSAGNRIVNANCPASSAGNDVSVVTTFSDGSLLDSPFHLIVFCPR